MGLLGDHGEMTSPGFDTLDPDDFPDATLKISLETHGFSCIRTLLAPNVALPGDEPYILKLRVASPWRNLPGSVNDQADGTGWLTIAWAPGSGPTDVQITEIDKAGTTPGKWLAFA